ncbi:hypothetical protein ACQPTN_24150 [Bradyrhizobium sp. 13971]
MGQRRWLTYAKAPGRSEVYSEYSDLDGIEFSFIRRSGISLVALIASVGWLLIG